MYISYTTYRLQYLRYILKIATYAYISSTSIRVENPGRDRGGVREPADAGHEQHRGYHEARHIGEEQQAEAAPGDPDMCECLYILYFSYTFSYRIIYVMPYIQRNRYVVYDVYCDI